ncbi:hypothetical protein [Neptunicoccus sediminis]|uniref:hypothetical protein n=1 Tax=Neptunicoccus sediminis TaxID=1892596 RepID=UPI0012FFBAE6|nr:hypothetical protein [Neptunicoccus sediminis]
MDDYDYVRKRLDQHSETISNHSAKIGVIESKVDTNGRDLKTFKDAVVKVLVGLILAGITGLIGFLISGGPAL